MDPMGPQGMMGPGMGPEGMIGGGMESIGGGMGDPSLTD
tara:strand:- start:782 stop:898 length:117 start_codon:yes stop_codon:yes gene_type:complete